MIRQRVFRVEIKFPSISPAPGIETRDYVEFVVAPDHWLVEGYMANRGWLFEKPTVQIIDLGTVDKTFTVNDFNS